MNNFWDLYKFQIDFEVFKKSAYDTQFKLEYLGDETFATPTILGDRIYTRVSHSDDDGNRQEMLYCLGK